MKGKKEIVALFIVNILIIGVIIYFNMDSDKVIPTIYFEDDSLCYTETMNNQQLLEGVKAIDDVDGDVSDSLIIEKITTDEKKEQAIIVYGAKDKHGNICKASRVVTYMPLEIEEEKTSTEEKTEVKFKTQETSEEETTTQETETKTDIENENADERENEDSNHEQEQQQEQQPQPTKPVDNTKIPVITFKTGEVKTKVGLNPAWVTVIDKLTDDVDSYEQLLSGIIIHGKYDNKKVGSYQVQISVKDSEGNESSNKNMTIIVEE